MGLDVAVDDPARVGERQGVGHLGGDGRRLGERERAAGEAAVQPLAGDELQHQRHRAAPLRPLPPRPQFSAGYTAGPPGAGGDADVEDAHNVRVGQPGDGAGLRQQAPPARRVGGEVGGQHLDGHLPPEPRVLAPVDGGHPTAPQDGAQPVAPQEQSVLGRGRARQREAGRRGLVGSELAAHVGSGHCTFRSCRCVGHVAAGGAWSPGGARERRGALPGRRRLAVRPSSGRPPRPGDRLLA